MATYRVDFSKLSNGVGGLTWDDAFNGFAALPALAAGDVVEIRSGVLTSSYAVPTGGAAGNPIVYRGDPTRGRQRLTLAVEGMNGITCTSKSNVTFEGFDIHGHPAWSAQDTVAIFVNGLLSNVTLRDVRALHARFNFVGGFNCSNITVDSCEAVECNSDGLRFFSGTGSYTWDGFTVRNCKFLRNGRAQGVNGAGISMYVQPTHTGTVLANVLIQSNECSDNYRSGVVMSEDSVPWNTLIAAGNTTPPGRRFQGVRIESNKVLRNGGAGIALSGAQPSSSNPVRIARNLCEDNGSRTTLGNIWTGACLNVVVEKNVCRRASSNGTSVGDGQGIFDDQWNDGAQVRWNLIEDNIYQAFNPDYTAYGIGIYRCTNSRHYGNIIRGCRHGFYIGTVSGATAPAMSGIQVYNNTITKTSATAFVIGASTPASALSIRDNLVHKAARDVEAQSGAAGTQAFSGNVAALVGTKYTGNNVGTSAFNHGVNAGVVDSGMPAQGSALLSLGTATAFVRDFNGRPGRGFVGAQCTAELRSLTAA